MPRKCYVRGCDSHKSPWKRSLRFHLFPRQKERHNLWLKLCGHTSEKSAMSHQRVCQHHFSNKQYNYTPDPTDRSRSSASLKWLAYPDLNLPPDVDMKQALRELIPCEDMMLASRMKLEHLPNASKSNKKPAVQVEIFRPGQVPQVAAEVASEQAAADSMNHKKLPAVKPDVILADDPTLVKFNLQNAKMVSGKTLEPKVVRVDLQNAQVISGESSKKSTETIPIIVHCNSKSPVLSGLPLRVYRNNQADNIKASPSTMSLSAKTEPECALPTEKFSQRYRKKDLCQRVWRMQAARKPPKAKILHLKKNWRRDATHYQYEYRKWKSKAQSLQTQLAQLANHRRLNWMVYGLNKLTAPGVLAVELVVKTKKNLSALSKDNISEFMKHVLSHIFYEYCDTCELFKSFDMSLLKGSQAATLNDSAADGPRKRGKQKGKTSEAASERIAKQKGAASKSSKQVKKGKQRSAQANKENTGRMDVAETVIMDESMDESVEDATALDDTASLGTLEDLLTCADVSQIAEADLNDVVPEFELEEVVATAPPDLQCFDSHGNENNVQLSNDKIEKPKNAGKKRKMVSLVKPKESTKRKKKRSSQMVKKVSEDDDNDDEEEDDESNQLPSSEAVNKKEFLVWTDDGYKVVNMEQHSVSDWTQVTQHLWETKLKTMAKLDHDYLKAHRWLAKKNDPCICEHCGKLLANRNGYLSHKRRMHGDNGKTKKMPKPCPLCGIMVRNLTAHRNKMHEQRETLTCSICQKTFLGKSNLRRHYRTHTGSRACDECDHVSSSAQALYTHKRVKHRSIGWCSFCNREFINPELFKLHMGNHERVQAENASEGIKCKECDTVIKTRHGIYQHMKYHRMQRQECPHCGLQVKALKLHIETVHSRPHIPCPVCHKLQKTKQYLRRHMLTHSGIRQCRLCGKQCSSASALEWHTIHFHKARHICNLCGNKFVNEKNLESHMLSCRGSRQRRRKHDEMIIEEFIVNEDNQAIERGYEEIDYVYEEYEVDGSELNLGGHIECSSRGEQYIIDAETGAIRNIVPMEENYSATETLIAQYPYLEQPVLVTRAQDCRKERFTRVGYDEPQQIEVEMVEEWAEEFNERSHLRQKSSGGKYGKAPHSSRY